MPGWITITPSWLITISLLTRSKQCVTVPKMLNDTDTDTFFPVPNIFDTGTGTFFDTEFFRYRLRDFYPIPNFTDTSSKTFLQYQIFPIPHEKRKISGTDTYTVPVPIINLQNSKKIPVPNSSDTGSETFFRYQIFPIPVPILFSGTKFFRCRFRYHHKNEKFPVPGIPGTGTSHSGI